MNITIKEALEALNERGYAVSSVEDVAVVFDKDLEDFPVYVSSDDEGREIVCSVKLFTEDDLIESKRSEAMEAMLSSNKLIPLSAFNKQDEIYELYGQLTGGSVDALVVEIETILENVPDSMDMMKSYFKGVE